MEKRTTTKVTTSDEMISIMPQGAEWLESADLFEIRFLFHSFKLVESWIGILFLGPRRRREIMEKLGCGKKKLAMIERKLVSEKLLIKVDKAIDATGSYIEFPVSDSIREKEMYLINGAYFWAGDWTDREIATTRLSNDVFYTVVKNSESTSLGQFIEKIRLNNNVIDV